MTNQTIENQTIPFQKLLPSFKKFLPKKSNEHYERLKNIHNNGEYLEATDSHVLFRIKQELVPDHNIAFTDTYPNLDRLIKTSFNYKVKLDYDEIKTLLPLLRELKPFTKKIKQRVVRLKFEDNKMFMVVLYLNEHKKVLTETMEIEINWYTDPFKIAVNINYLISILETLKKVLSSVKEYHTVKIGLITELAPMVFEIENVCLLELLPIRIFP